MLDTNEIQDDGIYDNTTDPQLQQDVTPETVLLQQHVTPEPIGSQLQQAVTPESDSLPSLATAEDERTQWNLSEMTSILRRAGCGAELHKVMVDMYEQLPLLAVVLPRGFRDLENDLGLPKGTMKNRSRENKLVSARIGEQLWTTFGASVTGDGANEDDYHDSAQSLRGWFAVRERVSEQAMILAREAGPLLAVCSFTADTTWETAKWQLSPAKRESIWLTALNDVCQWERKPRKASKATGKASLDDYPVMVERLMFALEKKCKNRNESPVSRLHRIIDCAQEILLDWEDEGGGGVEITPPSTPPDVESPLPFTHGADPYADRIVPIGDQAGVGKAPLLKESFGGAEFTPPPETEDDGFTNHEHADTPQADVSDTSKADDSRGGTCVGLGGGIEKSATHPVVELVPSGIPSELRQLRQFVGWKYGVDPSRPKPPKVPVDPATGRNARVSDPSTWGTFEQAMAAVERYGLDGIGFVLTEGDPFVCVDLDACRDLDTGDLTPDAWKVVDLLDTFTEISPSGTGVHVWCMGELPAGGRRKGTVEMYGDGRYICMSGQRVTDTPSGVECRALELGDLHRQTFGTLDPVRSTNPTPPPTNAGSSQHHPETLPKARLWPSYERALGKAQKLPDTHPTRAGMPMRSSADMSFCNLAAKWGWGWSDLDAKLWEVSENWRTRDVSYREGTLRTAFKRFRQARDL